MNDKQEERHELARTEEGLWDEFAALQLAKKKGCHDAAARVILDNKVHVVMLASAKDGEAIEKNQAALIEKTKEVEVMEQKVSTLQAQIRDMDSQIDIIIIEESCVRPQQFLSSFPIVPTSMTPLKDKLPCGLCGRFWAEMALANLPCGCLFHPCCMFKIALGKNPHCPSCDHVPGGVWMGQWGLVTNNATMQASIKAYRAATGAEGCASPLSREDAQVRIREISTVASTLTEMGWSVRKRTAVDSECEPGGGPAKLACVNETKSQTIPTEKMECRSEARDLSQKLVEVQDGGSQLRGIVNYDAMPSSEVDPSPSASSNGFALALKSTGVHDELAMELIQIAKNAAAEIEVVEATTQQEEQD